MKHSRRADVGVPLGVFAQWLAWIDAGEVDRVRTDLRALLADVDRGTDPPSSVDPPISTR